MLLDEGVPASIADPFRVRGHRVILHSDVLSPGAKDPLVAAAAIQNSAILIAADRDMRQLAKRWGNPQDGGRYKKLSLIFYACKPALAIKRAAQSVSFVEHEWDFCCQKKSRSMCVTIAPHYFTSHR